ncbi:MAG: (deoxy)nucleoside triphosphate pyrophosphohydrolase [Deltaproteobacteria bacterium]|jgi:8-oxo-dGTP diphosphatase|nr:(deoxy)nucleoside triphosphate pyrophosphohydrolase [Deltaproteobacteria bacterium]
MLEVTAAVIANDRDEFLICQRGPGGSCGNLWEFPGGKRETGETLGECLARECLEELGVSVSVGEILHENSVDAPDEAIRLFFFRCSILSGSPKTLVHGQAKWARPADMETKYFCPADRPVVELLKARLT